MSNGSIKKHHWIVLNYPFLEKARIFVYKEQVHNTLYFSANDIAYCLEYNVPHDAILTFIPRNNLSRLPYTNGIFLNAQAVSDFITDTLIVLGNDEVDDNIRAKRERIKRFRTWFQKYLSKCANLKTGKTCPQ